MEILGCVDVPVSWMFVGGILLLIYIYGKRRNRLFKDLGIPGPEPTIYIGNLHRALIKGVKFDDIDEFGEVYGVYMGGVPMLTVSNADMIREILIKQFSNFSDRLGVDLDDYPIDKAMFFMKGEVWRRIRRIASPTFSGAKLRLMCGKIASCADALNDNLLAAAADKSEILIKDYFGLFTMDVIASTAFGIDSGSQKDLDNKLVKEAQKVFAEAGGLKSLSLMFVFILPELAPLFKALGMSAFPKKSVRYVGEAVAEMIRQRKAEPDQEKRVDFLQLLIDAEDDGSSDDIAHDTKPEVMGSKKMTSEEILGQALLFFVAGYETTASTLHFVAYLLATNPDVQDRLIDEIDSVLGNNSADYDNIGKLVYLDHVITETLRLFPVVMMLTRLAAESTVVGDYTIPKGLAIGIPTYMIHRNPKVYHDPHKFSPDRWDRKSEIDPMNYLPFGHGPRQCIGMRLAQVEMRIALATILKKIRFVPAKDTLMTLEAKDLDIRATFVTKKPIKLKVEAR